MRNGVRTGVRTGVKTAYTKAVSSGVLVCVTLISGALFGMAAQSALFHLGLDFGSVRDDLFVGQMAAHGAHSRPALAWWAWWLVPLAAFFVGPLSVAITRWLLANWWLFRAARIITTAAVLLMLAAVGELAPAATTLDVRSGAAASMLVALGSALLAWLGARVFAAPGHKPAPSPVRAASGRRRVTAPPPDHVRFRVSPIPAPVPWRGGGSADAGAPFVRVRQRHSLIARFTVARLALIAVLALVVSAGVAAVSGVTVLVQHATPGTLRQLAARSGLPVEAPPSTAQVGVAATAPLVIARAEPVGLMIAGVLVPESDLTFAKGYLKRKAAIAAAITAAQRESARIVAAAEKAEDKRPKHVAALHPVQYGHARRHAAYARHAERHARTRKRNIDEHHEAPRHPDYRAHDRRRVRGHDHYARIEPHYPRF